MSTTLEQDLRGVAARHIGRASMPQLLQFIEQLGAGPAIAMPKLDTAQSASSARFVNLLPNGTAWLDPQDGEHVAVHDHQTGLIWSASIIGEADWDGAKKLAADCRLLGHSDWRLPTIQELLSIVDYERFDPAVNTDHFKGPYGYTWSGTPAKSPSGVAWNVLLSYGYSGRDLQCAHGLVRAVRAGQSLSSQQ